MPVNISQSAKLYRERRGLTDTRRRPITRHSTGVNRVHTYPMAPALPEPHYLHANEPVADTLGAEIWPHGSEGVHVLD